MMKSIAINSRSSAWTMRSMGHRCVVHRYADLLLVDGEKVIDETPYEAVCALRRVLQRLGVADAELVSLKTFRARKATAMMAAGDGLAKGLEAGD